MKFMSYVVLAILAVGCSGGGGGKSDPAPVTQPARILEFSAQDESIFIFPGETATVNVRWKSVDAETCELVGPASIQGVDTEGMLQLSLTETTDLRLTCMGDGSTDSKNLRIEVGFTVNPPLAPRIKSFSVDNNQLFVEAGEDAMVSLSWKTENVTTCELQDGTSTKPVNTQAEAVKRRISKTTEFILTCNNEGYDDTASLVVEVKPRPAPAAEPKILSFEADDKNLDKKDWVVFNWTTENVESCRLTSDHGYNAEFVNVTSQTIMVEVTTNFTLTCKNNRGTAPATWDLTVNVTPIPVGGSPEIAKFTADPDKIDLTPGSNKLVTFNWQTKNVDGCKLSDNLSTRVDNFMPTTTTFKRAVVKTTTFTLTCTKAGFQPAEKIVVVNVTPVVAPVEQAQILTFTATPEGLPDRGGELTLNWTTQNVDTCTLTDGGNLKKDFAAATRSTKLSIQKTTTFILTCKNLQLDRTVAKDLEVKVADAPIPTPKPEIVFFKADNKQINIGPGDSGKVKLSWETKNADSCTLTTGNETPENVKTHENELVKDVILLTRFTLSCKKAQGVSVTEFVDVFVTIVDPAQEICEVRQDEVYFKGNQIYDAPSVSDAKAHLQHLISVGACTEHRGGINGTTITLDKKDAFKLSRTGSNLIDAFAELAQVGAFAEHRGGVDDYDITIDDAEAFHYVNDGERLQAFVQLTRNGGFTKHRGAVRDYDITIDNKDAFHIVNVKERLEAYLKLKAEGGFDAHRGSVSDSDITIDNVDAFHIVNLKERMDAYLSLAKSGALTAHSGSVSSSYILIKKEEVFRIPSDKDRSEAFKNLYTAKAFDKTNRCIVEGRSVSKNGTEVLKLNFDGKTAVTEYITLLGGTTCFTP